MLSIHKVNIILARIILIRILDIFGNNELRSAKSYVEIFDALGIFNIYYNYFDIKRRITQIYHVDPSRNLDVRVT